MALPSERIVVLLGQDGALLALVAAELRDMGCRVFCVRSREQLTDLVRFGSSARFLVITLDDPPSSLARGAPQEGRRERLN